MFCDLYTPKGEIAPEDTRAVLKSAVAEAREEGISFRFNSEMEFYLFTKDEDGNPTRIPYDTAGYMDVAPSDRCENVRREICLTIEKMGLTPERSHHEQGPGQNEIDFRYADALTAADQAMIFQTVVKTVAHRNGYFADFSAKPLANFPGNGFHINLSVQPCKSEAVFGGMIAGVLDKIAEMTVFLNPAKDSYLRLGQNKAPGYISWSAENRSQLIRIPAALGEYRRMELRSPDPSANPYLAFALLIRAALSGIQNGLPLPAPADFNLYTADPDTLSGYQRLPGSLAAAGEKALASDFIRAVLPESVISAYCSR
jgi:glutamine synthetase